MVDLTGFKLTFDEEFNDRSIGEPGAGTTWSDMRTEWRFKPDADIGFGVSAFVDPKSGIDPFQVSGGALTITAQTAPSSIVGPGQWASGLIHTKETFAQQYGYFEMRADLPSGAGAWPAFWLLNAGDSTPAEIDVMENYGDTSLYSWLHTHTGASDPQYWSAQPTILDGYHTFGLLWSAERIQFFYDGQEMGNFATPANMNQPMYILANLAVQDAAGQSTAAKSFSIDYIRAYSASSSATAVQLGAVSSPDGAATDDLHGAVTAGAAAPIRSAMAELNGTDLGDLINGDDTPNRISGLAGADTLNGGGGNDTILAGAGDDLVSGGDGDDSIEGGAGFDNMNGNVGNDTVRGGDGGDWLSGGKGQDLLFGDAGNDIVYGNIGADTLFGNDGDDTIRGGQDDDVLDGGAGNDWLSGDRGSDTITGGAGADVFHISVGAGADFVTDFHRSEGDRVQLDAGVSYTVYMSGGDTIVDLGGADRMILLGVNIAGSQGDWLFAA